MDDEAASTVKTMVYASVANHPFTEDDILELLSAAKRNNAANGITGMLLYHDGFFMQAIEGEVEQVDRLFDRIRRDRRHKMVVIVHEEKAMERAFADWRMGFSYLRDAGTNVRGFSPDEIRGYSNFLERPDLDFFSEKPSRVKELLLSFRHRALHSSG
ncbi:MAG: hypothetical protein RIQ52_898 [Pseudomonadota bacterium]